MADHEGATVSPHHRQKRNARQFAHWVAFGAAIAYVAAVELGVWYASHASYPVCTGSTTAVAGGSWLLLAVLVLAPFTIVAGVVSLVRGPRGRVRVVVSLAAMVTVV